MSKIIAVATQKGGVSKTTTTGALASSLKQRGFKVLAVDMDPQSNLSFSMGADTENSATIYNVLKGELRVQFAIQHTAVTDIIVSNILLSGIELEFTDRGREFLLRNALAPLAEMYDYILIDTPPGLGILTVNALSAANCVIVPMLPDIFSLQGIAQVYETVEHVRLSCNPGLYIAGILLARFSERTRLGREVFGTVEMISKNLNIPLFKTCIRNCVTLAEAQSLQLDIMSYAPSCTGARDYRSLTNELIERGI